jgi:hypothetical protein
MSIGKSLLLLSMDRWVGGGASTAQLLSGEMDIMQHMYGLGHKARSLMTINTQDDGGRLAVCAMTREEAGDYVF